MRRPVLGCLRGVSRCFLARFYGLRSGDVTHAVARMPSSCPDGLRIVSRKAGKGVKGPDYARISGECKMCFRAPRAGGTESDCSFQRRCLRVFEGRGGLKWTSWEVLCARRRACDSISDLLKKCILVVREVPCGPVETREMHTWTHGIWYPVN